MSKDGDRRFIHRTMPLAALAMLLTGCATGYSAPDDLRIVAKPEGLYLMTRSTAMARSVCVASGFDAARAEGRLFADGRSFSVNDGRFGSGTQGCQMQIRTFTVCQEGDAACLSGETSRALNVDERK